MSRFLWFTVYRLVNLMTNTMTNNHKLQLQLLNMQPWNVIKMFIFCLKVLS